MQQALELSHRYAGKPGIPRILATAGIHPHEAQLADRAALQKLDNLLAGPDVLAVGEIGLDYYYDHSPREQQKQVFAQQMEIAAARQRPIIIHCRPSEGSTNAWDDTLTMIETDAPFLAPLPHRGKRNEPAWVARVAGKLAEVCGVTEEQVASSTANNFFRFFGVAPDVES